MKKIYEKSPVFIQNIILTLVNNYKYFQKFNAIPFFRPLSRVIQELEVDDFNDDKTLDRINSLIENATRFVPYYQKNKSSYQKLKNIDELKNLPILQKSTLKKFNDEFVSSKSNRFNSYFFKTSGSTGTPIHGAISNVELKLRLRIFLKALKLEGIDYSKPLARFPGADIARNGSVYRKDYVNNHLILSIYHLSRERIKDYFNALEKNKIEIIEGYPSVIVTLVRLLKLHNLQLTRIKHILTTAEKLLPHIKEEIETYFQTTIFDFYGSSEGSVFMYYSNKGYYLNSNVVGFFECVDENYNELENSKNGRMLVTSFTSNFTPLIRYDIGDYATIVSKENERICVSEIQGRQEEIYESPSGKSFGRFSLILKHLPDSILESQLILTQKSNQVKLQYTSEENLPNVAFSTFEKKFSELLATEFSFTYERVLKFDKTNRGKLSAVKIIKND